MKTQRIALLLAATAACGDDGATGGDTGPITLDGGADSSPDAPDASDTPDPSDTPDTPEPGEVDLGLDTAADAEPLPDAAPPTSCDSDADCADPFDCTDDVCDAALGYCVWTPAAGTCFINGVCYADGTPRPGNPCLACAAAASQLTFTEAPADQACDDGDACTVGDVCSEGVCTGATLECNDGNACTDDLCDGDLGCVSAPVFDGVVCDDGTACTDADECWNGTCLGVTLTCDDRNPCTAESCTADGGCVSEPLTGDACSDGDACTTGDACDAGACIPGGVTNCVDGNECTIDLCDPYLGCAYLPNLNPCCTGTVSICDDLDPCTTDICEPESGACTYETNTAVCDDGDACTVSDACGAGACGGSPRVCEDGNPCTLDLCDPDTGCTSRPVDGDPCDDGVACTLGDTCVAGICTPDVNECTCDPVFGLQAVKITAMRLGNGGHPGEALDLDLNPATCAPAANCSDGRHNALGVLSSFANAPLAESVISGDLMLVLDIDDIGLNPFRLAFHQGELDPANPTCDFQTEVCDYWIKEDTLAPETCAPLVALEATRAGTAITAGGRGATFPFTLPIGDASITITLYDVRFQGAVTLIGPSVAAFSGILGGAVPKSELLGALGALPPDALPIDPATIENLLRVLVQDDIDTDGDGTPDAASIGIVVSGIGAELTGVAR